MQYYLALGSNIGDRSGHIVKALAELERIGSVQKKSALYETEPYGYLKQDLFFNVVIIFESKIVPDELLIKIKKIEKKIGRKDRPRWHAREIDIDIIEYNGAAINTDTLKIPHPEFEKRKFVLMPLKDVAPHFHSRNGVSIEKLVNASEDQGKIKIVKTEW